MIKIITFTATIFLFACAANKKIKVINQLPSCLRAKIDSMIANPHEGTPQSISRYVYHGKTVYYIKSACCDKFNMVFDSTCHILGYPDGGFTGRGEGKMADFFKEAKDGEVIWRPHPMK